jgi:hypothetical protein
MGCRLPYYGSLGQSACSLKFDAEIQIRLKEEVFAPPVVLILKTIPSIVLE